MTAAQIAKWVIVAWLTWGALATISAVGKQRRPMTPTLAAVAVTLFAAQIVAVVLWWHA